MTWRSCHPGTKADSVYLETQHIRFFHIKLSILTTKTCLKKLTNRTLRGAAVALEDAVSLSIVLPLGTRSEEIVERLALYQKARKSRADDVQNKTRITGRDTLDLEVTLLASMESMQVNFG